MDYPSPMALKRALDRGEKYAKERGIDCDAVKVKINELFDDTLGALAADIRYQSINGQITEELDADGNVISRRRTRGISPRTAGELSRSLVRWAQFCGLMDGSADTSSNQTNFIQLNLPSDGASFENRWAGASEVRTLDVEPIQTSEQARKIEATVSPTPAKSMVDPATEQFNENRPAAGG